MIIIYSINFFFTPVKTKDCNFQHIPVFLEKLFEFPYHKSNHSKEDIMLKIIISPAKKMNIENDLFGPRSIPQFLNDTQRLMDYLKGLSPSDLKTLWNCNDQILQLNLDRLAHMDLSQNLSPAILTYEGLQYQAMAPKIFEQHQWDYIETHLFILSGFYGLIRPFDGVVPYRLEMGARLKTDLCKDLYDFWGNHLYRRLVGEKSSADDETIIVN
ncbi:MAG: YaaA family protein, partial [Firmicutes bacterium]|nr:YaaA family protein [Bacillota bacterium]